MWRRNRSIFDELDDMRAYMDSMFHQMGEPGSVPLLPAGDTGELAIVPQGHMHVDVTEHDDTVIVTVDMMPGITKQDISLDLINPRALRISCERTMEMKKEKEGYYLHERQFGSMSRVIPLPKPVSEGGVKATFRNGVLEVQLKKQVKEIKSKITIE
ncbi:MAG: Hsp20/alpha crystallin family protein [Methanoregula sp.]